LWGRLAVLLLVGVAAYVRYPIARSESIWRDEAQTLALAGGSFPGGILDGLRRDGNAPAFYLIEHAFLAPRGARLRELRDRTPALVFGLLIIPLSFLAGRRLAPRGDPAARDAAGLCAAGLAATAPLFIEVSTQARMYSAVSAVAVGLAAAALSATSSEGRHRAWILYGCAAVLLLYLHSFSAFLVAGFGLATGVAVLLARRQRLRWLVTQLAIAVLFLPGLVFIRQQVRAVGSRLPWSARPTRGELFTHAAAALAGLDTGLQRPATALLAATMITALGLAVVAIVRAPRRAGLTLGASVVALLLAWVAARFTAAFQLRYSIGALSVVLVTVGAGAGGLTSLPRLRGWGFAVGLAAVALLLAGQLLPRAHAKRSRSAARDAARIVAQLAGPNDVVVVLPDAVAPAVNYYLPPGRTQLDVPELGRVDAVNWQGWVSRLASDQLFRGLESAIHEAAVRERTLWLVCWAPIRGRLPRLPLDELFQTALPLQWNMARRALMVIDRYYRPAPVVYNLPPADEKLQVVKYESREREP
jgi:hypothetical protein